jgi:hypothetical protein
MVFWVVTPYELVGRYHTFGGTYCLYPALKMEAVCSSETMVSTNKSTTRNPTSTSSPPWEPQISCSRMECCRVENFKRLRRWEFFINSVGQGFLESDSRWAGNKFPAFMETEEIQLPWPLQAASGPCPGTVVSGILLKSYFCKVHFNIILPSTQ